MSEHNEFEGRPDLVQKRARSIMAWRLFVAMIIGYALVVLTIVGLNSIISLQTRAALISCVEPGGECFDEGQRRTGEVVQQLIDANELDEIATRKVVIAASTCAEQVENDTIEKIQACVDRIIKKEESND